MLRDRVHHRLEVGRGGGDDLQDVGDRRLLLERGGEGCGSGFEFALEVRARLRRRSRRLRIRVRDAIASTFAHRDSPLAGRSPDPRAIIADRLAAR